METKLKTSMEEYLAFVADSEGKSEYHDGEVVAMAGAQYIHNVLVNSISFLLNQCLIGSKCQVLIGDMMVKVQECNAYYFPDVTIVCEEPQLEKHRGLDVLLNPSVVIEILSETTALTDKTAKLDCYITLESLKQYVLVDSLTYEIVSYTKDSNGDWIRHKTQKLDEEIKIGECEILISDIYQRVVF
jgi:Uma2 family endonuclease